MNQDRRSFLGQALLAPLALPLAGCALFKPRRRELPMAMEEVPDFSDGNVLRQVVGIRPYRQKKLRLEMAAFGDKVLVHNYGHGGAGFTLSWGCAEIAAEWAASRAVPHEPIAVLGGGVVGMTAARVLQERGFPVRLYAAAFTPHVTSYFAGAQWGPSYVARGETDEEKLFFDEILLRSYRRFERMDGCRYGISHRLNYASEGGDWPLEHLPEGLLPPIVELDRLPFPGLPHRGKLFRTMFIEPPVFLPELVLDLHEAGAAFVEKRFASEAELRELPERIIVNCMGLGAGSVFNDELVVPVRGQLVHLKPKSLPYLLIHDGYIFPRTDAIVVGGTFEKGVSDLTPDPEAGKRILESSRSFFWGPAGPKAELKS